MVGLGLLLLAPVGAQREETVLKPEEVIELCTIAEIVAMNDDATPDEKADLARRAARLKRIAINQINRVESLRQKVRKEAP